MWRLGSAWDDEAALAARWASARPFPHIVVDGLVEDERLAELLAILEEEPVDTYHGEIFVFDATAPEPQTAAMKELRASFASTFAPVLARITGKPLSRVDMRAFAYRPGHRLLPHSDHQTGVGRLVAYAFYLPSPEPPEDGALELYACELADGELTRTESAVVIEPRANRIVVFDVSDVSLHQVREVLGGLRLSLAGWFYA